MAHDGIARPEGVDTRPDTAGCSRVAVSDQARLSMEEPQAALAGVEPALDSRELSNNPVQEEPSRSSMPGATSFPAGLAGQVLPLSSAESFPSVMDEQQLSVFKSRRAHRRIVQPTLPPLLGPQPESAARDVPPTGVPPVMAVPVPSPVSIIRPEPPSSTGERDLFNRDEAPGAKWQVPVMAADESEVGKMDDDSSPTKTEQCRNVARWIQEAADAKPPSPNGPRNHNQEAALQRDEDRLNIAFDADMTPPQAERQLPSIPQHSPAPSQTDAYGAAEAENDSPKQEMEDRPRYPPGHFATDERAEEIPRTLQTPDIDACHSLNSEEYLQGEFPLTPDGNVITQERPVWQDQTQHLDVEASQTLRSFHDIVQALQHFHGSSQLDDTFKEAVMASRDQTDAILEKTSILLNIVSALQQQLLSQSSERGSARGATGDVGLPSPGQRTEDPSMSAEPPALQAHNATESSQSLQLEPMHNSRDVGSEATAVEQQQVRL